MRTRHVVLIAAVFAAVGGSTSRAQPAAVNTSVGTSVNTAAAAAVDKTVNVHGRAMHLRVSGNLEHRTHNQPVIVLESGGQGTADTWRPIWARIADLGPFVAYDRSGLGQSEYDDQRPTVEHVAENLHLLLGEARIPPPYVLVGASWGGVLVRGFTSAYPSDVVGLVFLDATDYDRTCDELKAILPDPNCAPGVPRLPDGVPPAVRSELAQVADYGARGFADLRALRVPPDVAVAVVIGGKPLPLPPNALTSNQHALRLLQIGHQAQWALASQHGVLLVSSEVGHDVVHDDPSLVLQGLTFVWSRAQQRAAR
jgi:pimeloyl-ACP methyl ester carboxylesterase